MQVFVKARGNSVFHGSFYRIGREPGTYALSEPGRASAIISWMAAQLSYAGSRNHASQCSFA
jgi:hypothetical protein